MTWTPSNAQIGGAYVWGPDNDIVAPWQVTVKVSDGKGGLAYQQVNLLVEGAIANRAPEIISQPRTSVSVGTDYFYEIQAKDGDGDRLTYSVVEAPAGMTLSSGLLTWKPRADQLGKYTVVVNVSDGTLATQQRWTISTLTGVTNQLVNHAPTIASSPKVVTNVGDSYEYRFVAADQDNDVLFWELESGPIGMALDNRKLNSAEGNTKIGYLRWQPDAKQIGTHDVTLRVLDAYGAYSSQTFTIVVTGVNTPPEIVSIPLTKIGVSDKYSYQVIATDPEQDPLNFVLLKKPEGMTIHPTTGMISWQPIASQLGTQSVEVLVQDPEGGQSIQQFKIVVELQTVNHAPVISSTPIFVGSPGVAYQYQVVASDPDAGNTLTYQLLSAPVGVTINGVTGLLSWANPTIGIYQIVVGSIDQGGLGAAQGFSLTVRSNSAPVIQSTPVQTIALGTTYRYDVRATDAENDALSYTLNQGALDRGVRMDALGRLSWTPQGSDLSIPVSVIVTVKDAQGATVTQALNLTAIGDTEKPMVTLQATRTALNVGESVTYEARAIDNVNVAGLSLVVNGQAIVLDGQGRATVTYNNVATLNAVASAVDDAGNSNLSNLITINVSNPALPFNPNVVFDLPDMITAPTHFTIDKTGISRYRLDVISVETGEIQTLIQETAVPSDGKIVFDPSLLLNDTYDVQLTVFASNGVDQQMYFDTVDVEGSLKLGNFRLSFTDLSIPVTGIPISLTRTYDTLTANQSDDFGYGWRMEFRDTDLRTSVGKQSEMDVELGRYPAFDDRTKVFITLPGGKREAYTFKPKPSRFNSFFGAAPEAALYTAAFESEKGSTNTLSIESSEYITRRPDGKYMSLVQPFNPADAMFGGVYVLTTKEGVKYRIDARTGDLLTVADTNDNMLTYTDDAIVSSTGQKITFERDAQGRIVSVKDPMNEYVRYDYDAQGDLISVTDRNQNKTRMVYDTSYDDPNYANNGTVIDPTREKRSHFLREIIDPLGRVGARTEYDENGRLKQIIDVNGKAVDMTYDINNDKQVVKDQLGYETTYIYDDRGNVLREIDAEGKITDRTYDENNRVLLETVISDRSDNPNTVALEGFTSTYTYDGQGNKLTETNHLGQTTISTYNDSGRLLTETDSLGRTTTNLYSKRGNLTSTTDSKNLVSQYSYDLKGQVKYVQDANGKATAFDYDELGNVSQVRDAQGNITEYTYNRRGDKLTETRYRQKLDGSKEVLLTSWTYDSEGRMKSMINAENQTSVYGYDKQGRQVWSLDARGYLSESKYNDKGELVETWSSDGTRYGYNAATDTLVVLQAGDSARRQVRSMSYDVAGRKVTETDALGRVTKFVYDKVGRLIETIAPDVTPNTDADNARAKTEYHTDGVVKAQIDERGNRTEFRYDELGRQIAVIAADTTPNDLSDNPTTRYSYDKAGQQKTMTDALGHVTSYEYDELGRMVKTVFQDQSFMTQEYDKLGRRIAGTDQNGKRTEYRYDDLGRLTGVKDALNQWTEYGYNELGQLIYQEDALDRRTQYQYDSLGRRSITNLPLGQSSSVTHDEVGNLKTSTDFNGKTIAFSYDALNRLTEKRFEDGSKVVYGYTQNGLQDTVTFKDGAGITTAFYDWDYDVRDRLTKRTDVLGFGAGQTSRAIEYGYDIAGNQTLVTTASGTTTYTYDERNRLDLVKLNGVLQADYDYDAVNRLTQTTFGNGTRESRIYDDVNRLKELSSSRMSDSSVLSKYVYTLDKVGNRKAASELVNGQSRSIAYVYDDLYRLTNEQITDGVNGNRTSSYVYDAVGNRLGKTVDGVTTAYVYDANDRLINEKVNGNAIVTYAYDGNGSTKTKTENGVMTTYTWNDEKRLISAAVNGSTVEYQYNDAGIRVSSKVNGVETRYLLDEGMMANVWEEYSPNGTVQTSYSYGYDLITQTQGAQANYYLVDGLGSTRLLTDSQGQVVNAYGYEAFGETVSQSGNASNKYQFAGEQFDGALGDYYLRQRFYDPSNGRFGRMDTYEGRRNEPLTLHKYIYANGNSTNLIDPTGFSAIEDGNWVHDEITKDFLRGGTSRRADIAIRDIWEYEGVNSSVIPTSVVWTNRRNARPDLVDFHSQFFFGDEAEVYEIGTVKALPSKISKMATRYLPDINRGLNYAGRRERYTYGENYRVSPPILQDPFTGQTALVFAPIAGVISYVMLPKGTSRSLGVTVEDAFYWTTLLALIVAAAARASRTMGLA